MAILNKTSVSFILSTKHFQTIFAFGLLKISKGSLQPQRRWPNLDQSLEKNRTVKQNLIEFVRSRVACSGAATICLQLRGDNTGDKNLDGVVYLNFLCLIMCLHSLLIFVSLCIHCNC